MANGELEGRVHKAIAVCARKISESGLALPDETLMPFRLVDCTIFLSKPSTIWSADIAVSEPVSLDFDITGLHRNSRFVINQMVEMALQLYGSSESQPFAMAFLFNDGCGLTKFEPGKGYFSYLIERLPVPVDFEVGFSVLKG